MKLTWVGNKLSDIGKCGNLFDYSVNLYGKNDASNFSFPYKRLSNNIINCFADKYVHITLNRLINRDDDVYFMFYNPSKAYKCDKRIIDRTVCLNDYFLLKSLNNKITCHDLFCGIVKFPKFITLKGREVSFYKLYKLFRKTEFVIQVPDSAGGLGTFFFNENNENEIKAKLIPDDFYHISVFMENNLSFNVHLLIEENSAVIFPASVQLISNENNLNVFRGSDFINTDLIYKEKLNLYLRKIIKQLRCFGYRGVIGIDIIQDLTTGEIYFIEFNCRFQASSFLVNLALKDANLPSLQELNLNAFNKKPTREISSSFKVDYASVINYKDADSDINITGAKLLYEENDYLNEYKIIENFAYLSKKVYKKL